MGRLVAVSFVIILIIALGVGMLMFRSRISVRYVKVFWVRLTPEDTVEFGWEKSEFRRRGLRVPVYRNVFTWHRRSSENRFLVYASGDYRIHPEMRMTEDANGIWLIANERGRRVVASLDRRSGEFLGINRVSVDPSLSLARQEAMEGPTISGQKDYPVWATIDGGAVLAVDPSAYRR